MLRCPALSVRFTATVTEKKKGNGGGGSSLLHDAQVEICQPLMLISAYHGEDISTKDYTPNNTHETNQHSAHVQLLAVSPPRLLILVKTIMYHVMCYIRKRTPLCSMCSEVRTSRDCHHLSSGMIYRDIVQE